MILVKSKPLTNVFEVAYQRSRQIPLSSRPRVKNKYKKPPKVAREAVVKIQINVEKLAK